MPDEILPAVFSTPKPAEPAQHGNLQIMSNRGGARVPPSPGQRLLRSAFKDDAHGVDDAVNVDDLEGTDFDLTPVQVSEFQRRRSGSTSVAAGANGSGGDGPSRRGSRNLGTVFGHDLSDVPEFLESSQELTWLSQSQEEALKRGRTERTMIHQRSVTKSSDRIRQYKKYCRNCARNGRLFLSFRQWWASRKSELIRIYSPQTSPTQEQGGRRQPQQPSSRHDASDAHGEVDYESESFDLDASLSMDTPSAVDGLSLRGTVGPSASSRSSSRSPPVVSSPSRKAQMVSQPRHEPQPQQQRQQQQRHHQLHQRTRSTSSMASLNVATAAATARAAGNGEEERFNLANTPPGVKGQKLLRAIGPSPQARDCVKGKTTVQGGIAGDAVPELPEAAERAARRSRSRSRSVARPASSSSSPPPPPPSTTTADVEREHAASRDEGMAAAAAATAAVAADASSTFKVIERAKEALKVEEQQYEHLKEEVTEEQQHAKAALAQRLARRKRSKSEAAANMATIADKAAQPPAQQGSTNAASAASKDGPGVVSPSSLAHQLSPNSQAALAAALRPVGNQGDSGSSSRSTTPSPTHHSLHGGSRSPSSDLSVASLVYGGDSRPATAHNSPLHTGHSVDLSRTNSQVRMCAYSCLHRPGATTVACGVVCMTEHCFDNLTRAFLIGCVL